MLEFCSNAADHYIIIFVIGFSHPSPVPSAYALLFEQDYEKLAAFMTKYYKMELEKVDMSVRGWNWGNVNFVGKSVLVV